MNGLFDEPPLFDGRVRIGTSGYSFADWVGPFYPPETSQQKMLPFYTQYFDTVEVNFTYYRLPSAKTMEGMVNNTPDGFLFFVKAFEAFTHKSDLTERDAFLAGIAPMQEAGKLAGLLFQFPQSFKNTHANRQFLARVAREFAGHKVAVEFRDRSWAHDETYRFLDQHALNIVAVDEPSASTLFPRTAVVTGDVGYVRFHSRNADNWYKGAAERYDYSYAESELQEWLPMLEAIARRAKRLFIYFNNCHRGQAAANARSMKKLVMQLKLW